MNRFHPREGESGQGLVYVLIISSVLLVFLIALVDILKRESKWIVKQDKGLSLLHAADGAVDRGLYAIQRSGNWDGIPSGAVSGYDGKAVYQDSPAMLYTIKIQEGNWTPGYMIGDKDTERTITVFVTNTMTGEHKKVQAVVIKSTLNSALFSGGGIAIGGNSEIHWGPVVSYMSGPNTIVNPSHGDDHPVFMSRGEIIVPGLTNCLSPLAGVCYLEKATPLELADPPPVDFAGWRQTAVNQSASGTTHYFDPAVLGTACTKVGPSGGPPAGAYGLDNVFFYDTCDHQDYVPPATGSRLCEVTCNSINNGAKVQFNGGCGQGTLVVLGDLTLKGMGDCGPNILLAPPPDCNTYDKDGNTCPPNQVRVDKLFWDGFLYVAGKLISTGTKDIYGSIYANNTADVGGTFTVWYKAKNNALSALGKSIFMKVWMERAPKLGDVFP